LRNVGNVAAISPEPLFPNESEKNEREDEREDERGKVKEILGISFSRENE